VGVVTDVERDVEALAEVKAELEYLLMAAQKPGVISHHDAEDAEDRLLAVVARLSERVEQAERDAAAVRRKMHDNAANLDVAIQQRQQLERKRDTEYVLRSYHAEILGRAEARVSELEAALRRIANIGDPVDGLGVSPAAQRIARRALAPPDAAPQECEACGAELSAEELATPGIWCYGDGEHRVPSVAPPDAGPRPDLTEYGRGWRDAMAQSNPPDAAPQEGL
jgi:hypothetical protein